MIHTQQLDELADAHVIAPDGQKIGSVDDIYVDDATGEPNFALVNTGLFGMKSSFVPIHDADARDGDIHVRYSKDQVKDAPSLDKDDHLDPAQEQEIYSYYGLDSRGPATHDGEDAQPRPTGTDDAMTRSEEELHVGTRQKNAGQVRLRKHVTTEHVTKTVPVRKEEVRVEREPITDANRDQATDGPDLTDDEHVVTLSEEEAVAEKRTVPKERVRLEKEAHTDQETVEGDVAREEIDLTDKVDSRQTRDGR